MSDYFKDDELLALETAIRGDRPDPVAKLEKRIEELETSLAAAEMKAIMWRDKWRELVGIMVP